MVVVFAKLGEAHGGISLLVERSVIAAPQITVRTKYQHRLDTCGISATDLGNGAREISGGGISLGSKTTDLAYFGVGRSHWYAFGKHPHYAGVLLRTAVAAYDVVVQHRFNVPACCPGHLCEMAAAIQSLLFAGN